MSICNNSNIVNKLNSIRIISLLIIGLTFFPSKQLFAFEYVEPVYGKMADRISAKTAKILIKRHSMYAIGTGGGFIDHVNILSLSFQIRKILNQEDARSIIVDCIEEFLNQINSDEEIRPYLKNYPFTPANIEIEIYSVTKEGKPVFDPNIRVVSNVSNEKNGHTILWYCTKAPDQPYGYKTEIKEDYGEALRTVKESKKLLLDQSKCQATPTQAF